MPLVLLTQSSLPTLQAIQDITRNRDIDPEEIVALIFERIDVNGEGKRGKVLVSHVTVTYYKVKVF